MICEFCGRNDLGNGPRYFSENCNICGHIFLVCVDCDNKIGQCRIHPNKLYIQMSKNWWCNSCIRDKNIDKILD